MTDIIDDIDDETTTSRPAEPSLTIECFPMRNDPPRLVPGRPERDWMDDFANRHPYRCLPLTMANTTGWELLCPFGFEAEWDGRMGVDSITFRPDADAIMFDHFAASHFTEGVLTFHTGWLFRTPPGWALRASGVPNRFKHGIQGLEGLTETDWLPYPFTMNWRFTAPGVVRFEKDEPFCFLQPVEHRRIEAFRPVRAAMDPDSDLARQYRKWTEVRSDFNARIAQGDPATIKQAWQRFYFKGEFPDRVAEAPAEHVNKRRLASLPDAPPPDPTPLTRADVGFGTWSAVPKKPDTQADPDSGFQSYKDILI